MPPYYDSLIAKIIAHDKTRDMALARMRDALDEIVVEGIKSNVPLHQSILRDGNFMRGETNIHYLEKKLKE